MNVYVAHLRRRRPLITTGVLAILAILPLSCSRGGQQRPAPGAVPVTVAQVSQRDMQVPIRTFGSVFAHTTISVKSLVGGQLQSAYFHEGQLVHAGQLLLRIDPRPFQATVNQLAATLARDVTQADLAEVEAKRTLDLFNKGVASADERDTSRTTADAALATTRADRAALQNAQLQLSYCSIYAPVTGVTGRLLINVGNLVKANDDMLVVINQVQPIDVIFNAPEKYVSDIRLYQSVQPLKVRAYIPPEPTPEEGEVTFINNTVDVATGTIQLKAVFTNENGRLWPGQYVSNELILTTIAGATVVPSQAVSTGQQGKFVFVIGPDNVAQMRNVQVGLDIGGLTIINSGLVVGEKVVTDGQLKLAPGVKAEIAGTYVPPAAGAPAELMLTSQPTTGARSLIPLPASRTSTQPTTFAVVPTVEVPATEESATTPSSLRATTTLTAPASAPAVRASTPGSSP